MVLCRKTLAGRVGVCGWCLFIVRLRRATLTSLADFGQQVCLGEFFGPVDAVIMFLALTSLLSRAAMVLSVRVGVLCFLSLVVILALAGLWTG